MIAPFFLIILYIGGSNSAITSVPMESIELCEFAATQAKKLEGAITTVKTQCVRGEA